MKQFLFSLMLIIFLSGCTEIEFASHVAKTTMPQPASQSQGTFKVGTPYKVDGQRYFPKESYDLVETGIASWYGQQFHGKKTANGETFNMYELTAAHRTLQMPSLVRVTNLENGKSLIVRVNDRGPYKRSRVMDVSMKAAELLGFKGKGTAKVRLEVLKEESLKIAQAARSGQMTTGYEVALNQGGAMPQPEAYQVASAIPAPAPVSSEPLITPVSGGGGLNQVVPGHMREGNFYPDPVVTEMPVHRADIFVQAGSFTVPENAYRLSSSLKGVAPSEVFPAIVNGRQFYRVRLGPVASVEQADALLSRIVSAGNREAIIVIDEGN